MNVVDAVRYNHYLWRQFTEFFESDLSWEELSRNLESSHNTIANVTMHAVNMEDWWLHFVVPSKEWDGPAWDGFTDAKSMVVRAREVEAKTERFLAMLKGDDLTRPRTLVVGDDKIETTLGDVLFEVVNEATHHRGEVLAMLWSMDKEAPYESFLDWKASRAK